MERSRYDTHHRTDGSSLRRSRESLLASLMERARDSESPDSILIQNDLSIEDPFTQSLAEFCGLELYEAVNVAFEARKGSELEKRKRVENDGSTNFQVQQEEAGVPGSCGDDQMAFIDDQSKRVEVEREEENACDCDGDRMATIRDHESVERSHGQRRDDNVVTLGSFNLSSTEWPELGGDRGMEDQRATLEIKNRRRDHVDRGETSIMQPGTEALLNRLDFNYLLEQDKKKREAKKKKGEAKKKGRDRRGHHGSQSETGHEPFRKYAFSRNSLAEHED